VFWDNMGVYLLDSFWTFWPTKMRWIVISKCWAQIITHWCSATFQKNRALNSTGKLCISSYSCNSRLANSQW
jgi:hypothetical protein